MGFLGRMFSRRPNDGSLEERPVEEECPHGSVVPHWDDPADMGNADRVSYYTCDSCGATLARREAEQVISSMGDVVRIDESLRKTSEEEATG